MRGAFDDEEYERGPSGRDTELTLGPVLLTGIGVGLLGICGVCFVGGYAAGRRAPIVEVKPAPTAIVPVAAGAGSGAAAKPSATQGMMPVPCATPSTGSMAASASGQSNPIEQVGTAAMVAAPAVATPASQTVNQPLVHPALPAQTYSTPAASMPSGTMVEVAIVSQQQDADVLVNALRKRGYAAQVRRAMGEQMLHVQVGPFANRNDAIATRQRLLNDGYNAVVR